jgi:aryl-alcohol dehydrogenase-like predicted oxidoreductase
MITRKLGDTDLELSVTGLGTWAIGGGDWGMGWGDQDERDSIATIHEALECGINWIDTAHAYGFGVSEISVGKAVKEWNGGEVILATKCGVLPGEGNKPRRFISRETIREEVEGSLKRLQVDRIDLYQLHWPEPIDNLEEAWQALLELKTDGKIRWAGVCNCWQPELKTIEKYGQVSSNQPMYSLLAREAEKEVMPWCKEHGTGLVVYSPMHSGLLTGKVSREWLDSLPENDWRKHKKDHPVVKYVQDEHDLEHFLAFQESLRSIASDCGYTVAQLAVAWALLRPEVTSAIVGARRKGQIAETAKAAEWEMNEEQSIAIETALQEFLTKVEDA